MRIIFTTLLLLHIFAQQLIAQSVKLWGDNPPERNMDRSELTVFRPSAGANGISVIICPGGSYMWLGMKVEGTDIAQWLSNNGITAFVLRYRVAIYGVHHPSMIQDLQRAIQHVRDNSVQYGIDTDKLGVMGFSAGGHLAGTSATYFDHNFMDELGIEPTVSLRPAFVAMIYSVVSMDDPIAHKRSRYNLLSGTPSDGLKQMMSLEKNVREDMPPVFLVHCKGDKTVNYLNSEQYMNALSEKGIPYSYNLYDEEGHGFGIDHERGPKQASNWHQNFIPWLETTLRVPIKKIAQQ